MNVTVEPTEFTFVDFDAGRIGELARDMAERLGMADAEVIVEVDQRMPFGGKELRSLEPIHCFVESGALEHPQRMRKMSDEGTLESVGRLLLEARDRLDPDFGAPPLDEELDVATRVAWDAYLFGRLVRLGTRNQEQRRRYQFRNQHGFHDGADAAFDRLWNAESLTFDEIRRISTEAREH